MKQICGIATMVSDLDLESNACTVGESAAWAGEWSEGGAPPMLHEIFKRWLGGDEEEWDVIFLVLPEGTFPAVFRGDRAVMFQRKPGTLADAEEELRRARS